MLKTTLPTKFVRCTGHVAAARARKKGGGCSSAGIRVWTTTGVENTLQFQRRQNSASGTPAPQPDKGDERRTGSAVGKRVARFRPCLRHVPLAVLDSPVQSARLGPAVPQVDRRFCHCCRESAGQQRGRLGFRRFESDPDDPGPHSGEFGARFENSAETLLARVPGGSRRVRRSDNRCARLPIGSCPFRHAVKSPRCHRVGQAAASRPVPPSLETGRR